MVSNFGFSVSPTVLINGATASSASYSNTTYVNSVSVTSSETFNNNVVGTNIFVFKNVQQPATPVISTVDL